MQISLEIYRATLGLPESVGHASLMVRPDPFTHQKLAELIERADNLVLDLQRFSTPSWHATLNTLDVLHPAMLATASSEVDDVDASQAFRTALEQHRRYIDETVEPAVLSARATAQIRRDLQKTLLAVVDCARRLSAAPGFGSIVPLS